MSSILIGPLNSAGQGYQLAKILRQRYRANAVSIAPKFPPFNFDVDITFDSTILLELGFGRSQESLRSYIKRVLKRIIKFLNIRLIRQSITFGKFKKVALAKFDTFLIESGQPILNVKSLGSIEQDLELILHKKKHAAFLWHGSDIRDPQFIARLINSHVTTSFLPN